MMLPSMVWYEDASWRSGPGMLSAELHGRFWSVLRDQNADINAPGKEQAQEVSAGRKGSVSSWIPGHAFYASAESLSALCSNPEICRRLRLR